MTHLKSLRVQGQSPDTVIPFALSSYLDLVNWTGRIVRQDKRGGIPGDIPPIFERLRIDSDEWLTTMKAYAEQVGRQWVRAL